MSTGRTPTPQRAAEPETRDQTIARVSPDTDGGGDPSSRRHLGRKSMWLGFGAAIAAGVVACLLTLLLDGGVPFALALGGGVAICGGVIAVLLLAEHEDGRIEDIVDESRDEER